MIKFEEHDDNLFRMLDKPVPLTPDAEMPCLVRLIQDDSRLGILNKLLHEGCYHEKYLCTSCNHQVCHILINGEEYDDFYPKYEIIGYPVADGSNDWALYQMMQGEKVCHEKSQSIMYCEHAGYIRREVRYNCVDHMSVSVWLDGADNTGWQIYKEPEPQYKVGDWVKYGIDSYLQVVEPSGKERTSCRTPSGTIIYPYTSCLTKASPADVVIQIGCMSGTVRCCENEFICPESTPDNPCHFVLQDQITGFWSIIYFKMLDAPTRELVGSLLKAQEEE